MSVKLAPKTIHVEQLQPGQLILGFVDVPHSFTKLKPAAIGFLMKYGFQNISLFRSGKKMFLDADQLSPNDKLLTMGNMTHYIKISNVRQRDMLIKMGFKRMRVVLIKEYQALDDKPKSPPPTPPPSFGSSDSEPLVEQKEPSQSASNTTAPKLPPRKNPVSASMKKEEIGSQFRKLQDTMKVSEEVVGKGADIMANLFSKGNQQHFDLNQAKEVANDITSVIEKNKDAINVLSFLKEHDDYTFRHCIDVANQMLVALSFMNRIQPTFSEEQLKDIGVGALLHDIGKSRVPRELINKPGKLTDSEWVYMRMHPSYSAKIMNDMGLSKVNIEIGLYHHVHKDGTGYPKVDFRYVPIPARMCSIADVFQALTTKRPYRKTDPPFLALKKIKIWSAAQFDEKLTDIFIKAFGLFPAGSLVKLNDSRIAFVLVNTSNSLRPVVAVVLEADGRRRSNPEIIELMNPEYSSIQISQAVNVQEFFKNDEAVDLFLSIDV